MKVTLPTLFSVDLAALAVVGFVLYSYALSQAPALQTLAEQRATTFVQVQKDILAATAQSKLDSVLLPIKILTAPWNPWA